MLMECEKLHDRLQEYYNYEILMCIDLIYSGAVYPFSARIPPPLRWGMNCVPVPNVLDNKSKI